MPTIQLLIKGKVQAVFYRASAKKVADSLNITGWIKNTPDGNVELIATGSQEKLEKFKDWCHSGPPQASVSEIIEKKLADIEFAGFIIQR